MRNVEADMDRLLTHLGRAIRRSGFTQAEVQAALGWGRSYISQLLYKHKTVRVEQILLILNVINVTPRDFFAEVYPPGEGHRPTARRGKQAARAALAGNGSSLEAELQRTEALYEGIVSVLKGKGIITAPDLADAIERARTGEVTMPGIP